MAKGGDAWLRRVSDALIGQICHCFHTRHFNAAAAGTALHNIVDQDHVALKLFKAASHLVIGIGRQPLLLAPNQPLQLIGLPLPAPFTVQSSRLGRLGFIAKLSFVHRATFRW